MIPPQMEWRPQDSWKNVNPRFLYVGRYKHNNGTLGKPVLNVGDAERCKEKEIEAEPNFICWLHHREARLFRRTGEIPKRAMQKSAFLRFVEESSNWYNDSTPDFTP